jgi:hypothetical protein
MPYFLNFLRASSRVLAINSYWCLCKAKSVLEGLFGGQCFLCRSALLGCRVDIPTQRRPRTDYTVFDNAVNKVAAVLRNLLSEKGTVVDVVFLFGIRCARCVIG